MHNQTSIQLLEPLRARLAAQQEEFERLNGPVITQPIRRSLEPDKALTISTEAQRQAKDRKRGANSTKARARPTIALPTISPIAERALADARARQRAVLREACP